MADTDKKFLDEDGVNQFAEETKKYIKNGYYNKVEIDDSFLQLDDKYIRIDDTTVVRLVNQNEINLQEDHNNAWFGYRDGKVNNWKFGDGTEGGLADVYAKDFYLGDEKVSDTFIRVDDTTIVKLVNGNEINLQEDHNNAWFGYRGGKVTNWKFGDGTEGGLADVYVKDLYLGDEKLSDLLGAKANDDDVVHKTGDETIAGNKTFTDKTTGVLFSGNFECNNKTSYYGTDYFYALSINDGKATVSNISNATENRLILSVLSDNEKAGNSFSLSIPRDAATASDTSGFYIQWVGKVMNDVTPKRDNAFSLGLPDFRWENLYVNHVNGKDIAYASDIPDVSGLAVDSNVVHNTGNETVAGVKTFTSSTVIDGSGKFYQAYASDYIKGVAPATSMYQGIRFYDDQKTSTVANHITGAFEIMYNTDGYNKTYIGCRNYSGTSQLNYNVGLRVPNDATKSVDFFPSTDNKINLGTSNYRWADTNTVLLNGKTPAYASDLNDVSYMSRNETINGLKTFVNPLTVTRPNVGTTGYVIKLTFKRGEEISAVNHSTFRVTDSDNIIVSEVCTENYTDGKVAQILNVRNTNAAGAQIQSSISHLLDKTGDQDWFYSVRDGQTYLGTSSYRWADVNTVLLNGKTPAYADDLSAVATSGSYNDLSDKPTIPTVNNATLTIQKNGTTVETFTANASANVTANIVVPTKTSELTNDSGFLTTHNPVDSALSSTSTNAVQNKVINTALNAKANASDLENYLPKTTTLESLATNSVPFHNAYPRCKYLGTAITDAQNTAIKNRTYDDLFIGDYWTINGVNWRIVAIDPYYNVGDVNFDKGNIIVMPDTVLYSAQMNETNTTAGGYAGSLMRTQNLNNARTIARNAFGSHLANHRIVLANAVDASGPSIWAWCDSDGVELPSEVQIYGTRVWGSALKGYDVGTQKQQFPLMALAPQFVNIRQTYWLQDVSSYSVSSDFAIINDGGYADYYYASNSLGVRPSVTLSYI